MSNFLSSKPSKYIFLQFYNVMLTFFLLIKTSYFPLGLIMRVKHSATYCHTDMCEINNLQKFNLFELSK